MAMGGSSLVPALCEIAARVQRGRTQDDVLRIAGDGVHRLGMRFTAFQIDGSMLVLRHVATAPERARALEEMAGRPLRGLRASLAACSDVVEILSRREPVYRERIELFTTFFRAATGKDIGILDERPATAGLVNGVLAPISVREQPWGLLSVYSETFAAADASGISLFATHVASALEIAEYIEALERTQSELVERERLAALGELSAIIAHEVRNPLGAMFAAVATLRRALRSAPPFAEAEQADSVVDVIDEEARRLSSIVTDLLEFARPAALQLDRASLAEVLTDVASSATTRPEASAVDLRVDVEPGLPCIPLDRRLFRQAVENLVLNGLQAMPRGGTLIVRARTEHRGRDALACVDVIDTGGGIKSEHGGRVFEPFFTTKATGTGLGLPLVKRVVDAHGGSLSFVSSGAGTTFTVGVPIS